MNKTAEKYEVQRPAEAPQFSDDDREGDLTRSWDFFKQNTLPRREKKIVDGKEKWVKVEPGDPSGETYPLWKTTFQDLGDFGLGVGLYFSTLLMLTAMFVFLAILNSYSHAYFAGTEYSDGQEGVGTLLTGSAQCTLNETVTLVEETGDGNWEVVGKAVHNECFPIKAQGDLTLTTIVFISIFLGVLTYFQNKTATAIDENEQTAQDYAVVVNDPNPDAMDPDEWRDFFQQWGTVSYVTVALNNGPLLQALALKKNIQNEIHLEATSRSEEEKANHLDIDEPKTEKTMWVETIQMLGFKRDLAYWHEQLLDAEKEIKKLIAEEYQATKVYVIFENENSQRSCLKALSTGTFQANLEIRGTIPTEHMFRGSNVLYVTEPVEPTEVNFEYLHASMTEVYGKMMLTLCLTVALLVLTAFIITAINDANPSMTGIFISLFNGSFPVLMKMVVSLENHPNDSNHERSLLMKLVLCRWFTTGIIIWLVTPTQEIITGDLMNSIQSILWADAFTTPVIRLLDPFGWLGRLVLARWCKTQEAMNRYFTGTSWFLAERYTDMTKTLFVSLFFLPLMPSGLWITALAFVVCYWVDKCCLLRVWKPMPALDASVTATARTYMAIAIVCASLFSLHTYAGWPYDQLCEVDPCSVDEARCIQDPDWAPYRACDQEPPELFSVQPESDFMSTDQMAIVKVFRPFSLVVTFAMVILYFGKEFTFGLKGLFFGLYSPVGEDQGKPFSKEENIQAYVPQVQVEGLLWPQLACDLSLLDKDHISWTGDFDGNNLTSSRVLPEGLSPETRKRLFSVCKFYAPGPARP